MHTSAHGKQQSKRIRPDEAGFLSTPDVVPRRPRSTPRTVKRLHSRDADAEWVVPQPTMDVVIDPSSPHLMAALQHAMAAQRKPSNALDMLHVHAHAHPSPLHEAVSALTSIAARCPRAPSTPPDALPSTMGSSDAAGSVAGLGSLPGKQADTAVAAQEHESTPVQRASDSSQSCEGPTTLQALVQTVADVVHCNQQDGVRCIEQVEAVIAAYRRRCGGGLAGSAPETPVSPAVRMTKEAMKKLRPMELLVLAGLVRDGDVVHYKRRSGDVQAYGTVKYV